MRKMLAAAATLTIVGSVSAASTGAASAATPAAGRPEAGQRHRPVGRHPAGRGHARGKVSDFYADGMVSAEVNSHYGNLDAVQQKYAPFGIETGLCVGLASVAYQNEGLTLQPCDDPTTVWVIYPAPPATTGGYFPIVNATTTDFSCPFAMHLPRNEVASRKPLHMQVRHLQFRTGEKTLPARQLWGAVFGELN